MLGSKFSYLAPGKRYLVKTNWPLSYTKLLGTAWWPNGHHNISFPRGKVQNFYYSKNVALISLYIPVLINFSEKLHKQPHQVALSSGDSSLPRSPQASLFEPTGAPLVLSLLLPLEESFKVHHILSYNSSLCGPNFSKRDVLKVSYRTELFMGGSRDGTTLRLRGPYK